MTHLESLLRIASEPFTNVSMRATVLPVVNEPLSSELQRMLERKNGFAAFESALVVFPLLDTASSVGLGEWNRLDGWRLGYKRELSRSAICFAHDAFGVQFVLKSGAVFRFDPEDGLLTHYAHTLDHWAKRVMDRHREDTGWPVAHEWQAANGPLRTSQRLLPKLPFVLGGDYVPDNLVAIESRKAMENWAKLCAAIKSVPDGTEVSVSGWLRE